MVISKYQLLRKLATGGLAEVFLAKAAGAMGFEKTLVLKRILPHLAEDPRFVQMFLSEAKLAAQLNHPYLVQIFDFGQVEGTYYLAMEYIDGPNLRVLARRARRLGRVLSPALCARIIANACEGLAFAHDSTDPATGEPLGLIHRDISPENLLVSRQGAVKVVDFGIAKAASRRGQTQAGQLKGKLSYMSPEQVRGQPLDRRVDVYALGIVLYELLTGRKPFEAITLDTLADAILSDPWTPAVQHRPDLPEALQRILDRAIARDREQRYPDCQAFQQDLEEFILSTGKPMGAYQLSQFVTEVMADSDTSALKPVPGSPLHELAMTPTGPRNWRLPPIHRGVSAPRPESGPSGVLKNAELDDPSLLAPTLVGAAPPIRSASPAPKPQEKTAPASLLRRVGRLPAFMGVVLLAACGGYVFARTSQQSPRPQPLQILEAHTTVSEPQVPTSTVTNVELSPSVPAVPELDTLTDGRPARSPASPERACAPGARCGGAGPRGIQRKR
jgi:serine/threonine-protein kinase